MVIKEKMNPKELHNKRKVMKRNSKILLSRSQGKQTKMDPTMSHKIWLNKFLKPHMLSTYHSVNKNEYQKEARRCPACLRSKHT